MMAAMALDRRRLPGFQGGFQVGKSTLGGGQISGFKRADQALVVCVRLAVAAKGLSRRGLGIALEILLECCQRGLGGGNTAGLQGIADGIEVLDDLTKTTLGRGWVLIRGRRYAGYGAHIFYACCICFCRLFWLLYHLYRLDLEEL